MSIKIDADIKSLDIETDLSRQDLSNYSLTLKNLGEPGLKVIKIMKDLAQAIGNINEATCHLQLVSIRNEDGGQNISLSLTASNKPEKVAVYPTPDLSSSFGCLNIDTKARRALVRANISSIEELINCTEEDLLEIKNFGERSLINVKERLSAYGLSLKTTSNSNQQI